jgi:dTDP-4-amino-4,6-dideoxy-D-galactose acyltransferase
MDNKINSLEWDSKLFGYPVAQIFLDNENEDKLDYLFHRIKSENYRLTYFFVHPQAKRLIKHLEKNGCILVDQKTVYSKPTEKHNLSSGDIIELGGDEIEEKLIDLAFQAGSYSRFRIDKNFINREFERLYLEWLTQSIKKKIAFKILISKKESNIVGIITIGEKDGYANLGLVAVDRNYRRQGIGKELIYSADNEAFEKGLKRIKVVTQLKNAEACFLYEKCQFKIEKITNIYHFWQK